MFRDHGSSAGPALFLHCEYLSPALRTIPNRRPCDTRLGVAGPSFFSFYLHLVFLGVLSTVESRRTTWSQDSLQTNKQIKHVKNQPAN
jgi:hypothetical protein